MVPPPPPLRRYLNFARLTSRSLEAIARAVDRDDDFRARVAEVVDEADVGRPAWLWLTRPEGWADEVEAAEAHAVARAEEDAGEREERLATRRLAAAQAVAARAEAEATARRAEADTLRAELGEERAARLAAEERLAELEAVCVDLTSARAEVVRNLKHVEARLVDRATEANAVKARLRSLDAEARELRKQLAADGRRAPAPSPDRPGPTTPLASEPPVPTPTGTPPGGPHAGVVAPPGLRSPSGPSRPSGTATPAAPAASMRGVDPAALAAEVARAAEGAAGLAEALGALTRLLGTGDGPAGAAANAGASTRSGAAPVRTGPAAPSSSPPVRRVPVVLPGGILDDSVEAAEHLLRTPGTVLVVDGYNVTMEGWPELRVADQRRRLVVALSDLAARTASMVEVVFDGAEVEPLPAAAPVRPLVRVRFSDPGIEADDVVIDLVGRIPAATPVIVVSSDKRVRDGARRGGANLLHARQLVAILRR